jgi:hypothetical protein
MRTESARVRSLLSSALTTLELDAATDEREVKAA